MPNDNTAVATRPTWQPVPVAPIASPEEYQTVGRYLLEIKAFQKRVAEWFEPHKRRALEAHRALCADEQKALAPALADEKAAKAALCRYDDEQEAARKAEETRLQTEARKDAERRQLDEAAALETQGLLADAMALLEEPPMTPTVVLERSTPKVQGLSFRDTWTFRITNEAVIPRQFLKVDEAKLRAYVRAMKASAQIPGVEVYVSKTAAAGGRSGV